MIGDFLLGYDDARNNDQCRQNSLEAESKGVITKKIDRDELRIEPKKYIDMVVDQVNELMQANPTAKLILNIDADSFNGIPSSAETNVAGIEPKWAFYLCSKAKDFVRSPKIVRIAELSYPENDIQRQNIATEFAAECLKNLIKNLCRRVDCTN